MDIHEYQAKIILSKYGIKVPPFDVVSDLEDVHRVINEKKLKEAVVKVQVHAGGRGKAGGVKLARSHQEILDSVKKLLKMRIVNNQTGKDGVVAHQVMISDLVSYEKEYYISMTIDRDKGRVILIASPEGGMDIEEIAVSKPESILKLTLPLSGKFRPYHYVDLAEFMGWTGNTAQDGKLLIDAMAKAFLENDASLLEINPLVKLKDGSLLALDAKLSIEDNALFRHKDLAGLYDKTQVSPMEARAKESELAYISLDGEIGCMVNGAGLAMATMDIINYYGGKPANFLDVGGGSSKEKVAEGFKIILSDKNVKTILVNIFGGIMNCATLAGGIIEAAKEQTVMVPLVVRMEGTNVEEGRRLLDESGLKIHIAKDLDSAAKIAVDVVKKGGK